MSTRKAASAIGVSQTLILTILHDDLHLKPYKFHNFQALEDADYEKRLIFANWFISLPKLTEMFMFFSDEAYFYLRLPINKQNNRYWGDTDQLYTVEVPLHDEKVLVWCAISASKCIGPYFFDGSVNSTNYLHMLKTFFVLESGGSKIIKNTTFNKTALLLTQQTWFNSTYPRRSSENLLTRKSGRQGHQT